MCTYNIFGLVSIIDDSEIKKMKLVKVEPIEYQRKLSGNRHPRIIRYRNLGFSSQLTELDFAYILDHTKLKKGVKVIHNRDRYISYKYGKHSATDYFGPSHQNHLHNRRFLQALWRKSMSATS